MIGRFRTASTREAEAAAALLRTQGFPAQAETSDAGPIVWIERATVEAVELLLRRAPTARPV